MKNKRLLLWLVVLLTVLGIIIDLPHPPSILGKRFRLIQGLDIAGGVQLIFKADLSGIKPEERRAALLALEENLRRRVDLFGLSEAVIQTAVGPKNYRILVELPGFQDATTAAALIGKTAQLEFRREVSSSKKEGTESPSKIYFAPTELTGKHLAAAFVEIDQTTGQPMVGLHFTKKGAELFAKLTRQLKGKRLAIFLDNQLLSAPVVEEEIKGGQAVIRGNFTLKEVKNLVALLNSGALPVPLRLVGQRQIGPSLGQAAVQKSIRAGLIGLGLVAGFMVTFYGWLGFLAVIGLIIYGILTLALYKLIPVTLSLPGLTGFILSIGMAVDANILIFERLKEEIWSGKPWGVAVELAFGRAWDSIRDANVCTLITSFILLNPFDWRFLPTSGLVRGFATTLALGVLLSLFTGVVVTRTLIRAFVLERHNERKF